MNTLEKDQQRAGEKILIVDGKVKFCPYQPAIGVPVPGALAGQQNIMKIFEPCGSWCVLFRNGNVDNQPKTRLFLACSKEMSFYDITEPEPDRKLVAL